MLELWISEWFKQWFFTVNILDPKFAVLPRSKQLMPVTVKFRLDFLLCGLQSHLFPSFDVGLSFHATKATNQWRIVEISNSELEAGLPAFQLPMFTKCDALPKRGFLWHACQRNPCHVSKSKPPLPTRSLRSLRAAAPLTSSALWLHNACKR